MADIDFESLFRSDNGRGPARRRPRLRWPWVALLLLVAAFLGGRGLATLVTDALWFAALGHAAVLRTQLLAPLALFGTAFAIGFAWLAAHWMWAARRVTGAAAGRGPRAARTARVGLRWVAVLSAAALAGATATAAASAWQAVLLYSSRAAFGSADPIFGRDIGFFVFDLPVWHLVQRLVVTWVSGALVGAAVVYGVGGAVEVGQWVAETRRRGSVRGMVVRVGRPEMPRFVRAHLMSLAGLLALGVAWGQWLARFDLVYAERASGVFYGPGYADAQARLSAYGLCALALALAGALFLVGARWGRLWLPPAAAGIALALRLVAGEAYPSFVQSYLVRPNELERERPYIGHNIALTRAAYGLADVATTEYLPGKRVAAESLTAHRATVDAIRLWDWRVLLDYLDQRQSIRPYYDFIDVDVDRYALAGGSRQVEIAARELDIRRLSNPSWINRHLEYTHGFGTVVVPVNAIGPGGQPVLWARDLPPAFDPAFDRPALQPRIYFGEATDGDYAVVRTRASEFDYPQGDANARTTYDGRDGVALGSRWRRMLFTLRFGDTEILLSSALEPESRVLMYRNLVARAQRLAPFLLFDRDPYLVHTADGRMVWLLDAYTATDRYPYAQPSAVTFAAARPGAQVTRRLNYIRNSVKVAIDAYDGTVAFHVADPADPLIQAWSRVFPGLFQPAGAMAEDLVAHWRYPETLFQAQAVIYARYHMASPDVFYNAEDLWEIPAETRGQGSAQPMSPYYVTMALRDADAPEFLLMLPFAPAGKKNMAAWLAARSDPAHYGELVLYNFGKGQQVDGPEQIESRIDNDTEISAQLTLWSQAGSETIRGNLLVIPLGDALLYVEPLYLQAETNALPELKRVIVADGERVVMRLTLAEALAALTAGEGAAGEGETARSPGAPAAPGPAPATPASRATATAGPGGTTDGAATPGGAAGVAALWAESRRRQRAAGDALARGDWLGFGREMDALQRTLDRLESLTGTPSPDAPPPTPTSARE